MQDARQHIPKRYTGIVNGRVHSEQGIAYSLVVRVTRVSGDESSFAMLNSVSLSISYLVVE